MTVVGPRNVDLSSLLCGKVRHSVDVLHEIFYQTLSVRFGIWNTLGYGVIDQEGIHNRKQRTHGKRQSKGCIQSSRPTNYQSNKEKCRILLSSIITHLVEDERETDVPKEESFVHTMLGKELEVVGNLFTRWVVVEDVRLSSKGAREREHLRERELMM